MRPDFLLSKKKKMLQLPTNRSVGARFYFIFILLVEHASYLPIHFSFLQNRFGIERRIRNSLTRPLITTAKWLN